jgi:hypothetical protein
MYQLEIITLVFVLPTPVRSIVMARQALFPETVLDGPSLGNVASASADDDDTIGDGGLLSSASSDELDDMDELLANLAAWNKTSPDASATAGVAVKKHEHDILKSSSSSDAGKETSQLVAELNEWRTEHAETPYDKWSDERKQSLMVRSLRLPCVCVCVCVCVRYCTVIFVVTYPRHEEQLFVVNHWDMLTF